MSNPPALRISLPAWLKFRWFLHACDTEIGFLGVTHPSNSLLIRDFLIPKQVCTPVSVKWDPDSVASLIDDALDAGLNTGLIYAHTHPGSCAQPSGIDDREFNALAERTSHIELIVSRTEAMTARLASRCPITGLPRTISLSPVIDYSDAYLDPCPISLPLPIPYWQDLLAQQVSHPAPPSPLRYSTPTTEQGLPQQAPTMMMSKRAKKRARREAEEQASRTADAPAVNRRPSDPPPATPDAWGAQPTPSDVARHLLDNHFDDEPNQQDFASYDDYMDAVDAWEDRYDELARYLD